MGKAGMMHDHSLYSEQVMPIIEEVARSLRR